MTRSVNLALTASLLLLGLAGCQQQSAPDPTAGAVTQSSAAPSQVPAASSSALSIQPASIATCGTGIVATVHWDASAAHSTTSTTQIWVGSNPTDIKLFSENGPQGETQTGPWTGPGTYFVLKSKDDGKVLAHAMVGGPECP